MTCMEKYGSWLTSCGWIEMHALLLGSKWHILNEMYYLILYKLPYTAVNIHPGLEISSILTSL